MTVATPSGQSGSVTFATGFTVVTIAAINTANSVIKITGRNDNNSQDQRAFAVPYFQTLGASITSFTILRDASGSGNETINWEVCSSASQSVQHFNGNNSTGSVTTSLLLSSVDTTKTYPIYYSEVTINALDYLEVSTCDITSSTNCDITTGGIPRASRFYSVQIVEIDDPAVTVQKVTTAFTTGTTATPTISAVDTTRAFCVSAGFRMTDVLGAYPNWAMLGTIGSSTSLDLRRNSGTNGAGTAIHYAVEIDQDGVLVQSETSIAFGSGALTATSTFGTAIVLAESFNVAPTHLYGWATTAGVSARSNMFSYAYTTTTMTMTRGLAGATSGEIASQIVSIGSSTPPSTPADKHYFRRFDRTDIMYNQMWNRGSKRFRRS
jgi:hypothetical protein